MRFGSLFFLIVTLAGFQLSCQRGGEPAPGTRPVVVLVGLDGADWSLIDPLIDQGKLPLFKELKEKGAWGTLRTATPAKSPVIWTSIATGKT
ncbi:MAG TPA: alkaline phosphatase family protein, partial [Candidatus Aminicenantes bacterium]|nr:alkaline phosphatase family protein [Candidatus Aminicenantes bacterium]